MIIIPIRSSTTHMSCGGNKPKRYSQDIWQNYVLLLCFFFLTWTKCAGVTI